MTEATDEQIVALPRSGVEFDAFLEDLFTKHPDIPNTISYKHAIASMLNRVGDSQTKISLVHVADCVRAAQTKQVAFAKVQEYKEEWAAIEKAEKEKAEAAANEKTN